MVVEVRSEEEFNRLINDGSFNVTIVDFTASWCPPCRAIKPYFEDLSKIYTDVQFLKVDVDELPDVSGRAGVRSMPTFVIYKNGVKSNEKLEGANRDGLVKMISRNSNKTGDNQQQHQPHSQQQRRSSSSSQVFGFFKKCTIL